VSVLAELALSAPHDTWRAAGLLDESGVARFGSVIVRIHEPRPGESAGLTGWTFAIDEPGPHDIDGIPTSYVDLDGYRPQRSGMYGFDHVVVMTDSIDRTCSAIHAALGLPLKRIREAGSVRQGFHRAGDAILEVVETAQHPEPHPFLWGLVFTVADLDEWCRRAGPDVVGEARPAVQPGRRIASIRTQAGLGVPVAVMSADERAPIRTAAGQ
jgi:hypothetical protein